MTETFKTLLKNIHTGAQKTVNFSVLSGTEVTGFKQKVEAEPEYASFIVKKVTCNGCSVNF